MIEILFADDDAAMREMVGDVLTTAGFAVRLASNGTEALRKIKEASPALIILDYRMGDPDGLAVCRRIKADGRLEHLPVLILTAESAVENRIDGFDAGADDYLAKPFDNRELLGRVRALLRLSQQALHRNPTTGLPGGEAIAKQFERRRASGRGFSACYFDLDHFKPFSDHFGFALADRTILLSAECLTTAAHEDEFVGHVGGDDFVLFCDSDVALERCEEVRTHFDRAVRELVPEGMLKDGIYRGTSREGEPRVFPITRLSAAILRVPPGSGSTLQELGETLARAKREAKNAVGVVEVTVSR
jgi:PleD family two-component response regulator